LFAQTEAGAATVPSGTAVTGTLREPDDVQPADDVTVTVSDTAPGDPAVNVIFFVPAPDVIVPFVIDQEYAAPPPAFGTEALLPGELAQTDTGAVMTEEGIGSTLTFALPEEVPEQAASESDVTEYVVLVDGLTVRVAGLDETVWVNPSDQIRLQGAVPIRAAWITVEEPAQIVASPETAAFGGFCTVTTALPEGVPPVQFASETDVTV
jgi:hypothetical protein